MNPNNGCTCYRVWMAVVPPPHKSLLAIILAEAWDYEWEPQVFMTTRLGESCATATSAKFY